MPVYDFRRLISFGNYVICLLQNYLSCQDVTRIFTFRSIGGNMIEDIIERFQEEREKLNDLVMKYAGPGTKRFYPKVA